MVRSISRLLRSFSIFAIVLFANVVVGQNPTFREILNANPEYSTFAEALDTASLDVASYGPPLTVFAPDNAAFDNFDSVLRTRLFSSGFSAHLKYVLETHIVRGAFPSASLPNGDNNLTAVNGVIITFRVSNRRALQTIFDREIESSEGIFYGVNAVILPSDIANIFISDVLALSPFSVVFNELLLFTGLNELFSNPTTTTATVFAPNNDAFEALGAAALANFRSNVTAATELLSRHIVLNRVVPSTEVLLESVDLGSYGGQTLAFENVDGSFFVNNVEVITPDVLVYDGIVHIVNEVIAPLVPAPVSVPTPVPVESPPTPVAQPSPTNSLTFRELMETTDYYSYLLQAIDAVELDFADYGLPLTLLAPYDAGFLYSFESDLDYLDKYLTSSDWSLHLLQILEMHILDGAIPSFVDGEQKALNGETLTFYVGQIIEISSPASDDAILVIPGNISSEGIFYELDSVLLPAFWNNDLLDLVDPENEPVANFSIFYELLTLTGLNTTFQAPISTGSTATVFAPNDDAFIALGDDALAYYRSNIDVTRSLLSGHLVNERAVPLSEEYDTPIQIESGAGEPLIIEWDFADDVSRVNDVEILRSNILAYNGIVHVLGGIIAVPGTEYPSTPTLSPAPVMPPISEPTLTPAPADDGTPPTSSPADAGTPSTPSPVAAPSVDNATPSPVASEVTSFPVTSVTFRDIIDSDPNFSTLGLTLDTVDIDLGAFDFPVTIFAPNNDAFAMLDPTLLNTLLSPGWDTHLIVVLASHIVNGAIPSSLLVSGELVALNGEILTVSVGEPILISSVGTNDAEVILPEIVSADGVFYELNEVLLPSFVNVTISDILASPDLSILNELLILTGLDQLFASRRLLQDMVEVTGSSFTVFAPNNDAFNALGTDLLDFLRSNLDNTRTLLLGHIVLDQVVSTRSLDGGPVTVPSAAGDALTVMSDFKDDGSLVNTVNDVEILISDVLAINGILHVIARVLDVVSADLPDRPSDAPSASPSADVNCEGKGKMSKKGMEKSKKMEKIGKGSKSGKGMGKGISFDSIGNGSDSSGKGKGANISFDEASKGKGKGSKTCGKGKGGGSSKKSSKRGKGKGSDSSGKGKGSDASAGKGMSADSSSGKGMGGDSTSKGKEKSKDGASGMGMTSDGSASKGMTSDSSTGKGMGSDSGAGMGMSDATSTSKGMSSDGTGKGKSDGSMAGKMGG